MSSDVKLSVYDVFGREVAALVDAKQSAGTHEGRFDASKLSSGFYFYKLIAHQTDGGQAGSFVGTKEMLLIK